MDLCSVSFVCDPWLFTALRDQRHAIGMDMHRLLNHLLHFTSKTITSPCSRCSTLISELNGATPSHAPQQNATSRFVIVRYLAPLLVLCLVLLMPGHASASTLEIPFYSINTEGIGASIGTVLASDSDQGLVIKPALEGLSEGEHGFHLHSGQSCQAAMNPEAVVVAGLAAKGHWDPDQTGTHLGPFADGHRGDLSRLIVNADGTTTIDVVAPHLRTADLKGRALVVHAGGDTYSDVPPLGGGGARIGCGVAR